MLGKVVSAERVKLAIVSGVVQRVLVVGLRRQGPLADAKDFAAADGLCAALCGNRGSVGEWLNAGRVALAVDLAHEFFAGRIHVFRVREPCGCRGLSIRFGRLRHRRNGILCAVPDLANNACFNVALPVDLAQVLGAAGIQVGGFARIFSHWVHRNAIGATHCRRRSDHRLPLGSINGLECALASAQ